MCVCLVCVSVNIQYLSSNCSLFYLFLKSQINLHLQKSIMKKSDINICIDCNAKFTKPLVNSQIRCDLKSD